MTTSTEPPVQTQNKCSGVVAENIHVTLLSPLQEFFGEPCSNNGQDREKVLADVLIKLYSKFQVLSHGGIYSGYVEMHRLPSKSRDTEKDERWCGLHML